MDREATAAAPGAVGGGNDDFDIANGPRRVTRLTSDLRWKEPRFYGGLFFSSRRRKRGRSRGGTAIKQHLVNISRTVNRTIWMRLCPSDYHLACSSCVSACLWCVCVCESGGGLIYDRRDGGRNEKQSLHVEALEEDQ